MVSLFCVKTMLCVNKCSRLTTPSMISHTFTGLWANVLRL
jgi:hypothetical protein